MQAIAVHPPRTGRQELLAGATLALLGSVAIMYANFMNVAILGMHERLALSLQTAGDISSLNLLGVAIGALAAGCLPGRLVGVKPAALCLTAMLACDVACSAPMPVVLLAALRALHGLAGGVVLAFCGAALGSTRAPQRIMGVGLAFQLAAASLASLYLPKFVMEHGLWPVFCMMALLESIALALLLSYRELMEHQGTAISALASTQAPRLSGAGVTALAALLLFQGARFMIVGYGFQIGHLFGYDKSSAGAIIGLASWMAGGGALAAAVMPARWGRIMPMLLASLANLAASVALIRWGAQPHVFALAMCAMALFTFIALPYQYGICFALDEDRRLGMWTGFASKTGLAAGPAFGAFFMLKFGLFPLLALSAGLVFLATLAAIGAALTVREAVEPSL